MVDDQDVADQRVFLWEIQLMAKCLMVNGGPPAVKTDAMCPPKAEQKVSAPEKDIWQ